MHFVGGSNLNLNLNLRSNLNLNLTLRTNLNPISNLNLNINLNPMYATSSSPRIPQAPSSTWGTCLSQGKARWGAKHSPLLKPFCNQKILNYELFYKL